MSPLIGKAVKFSGVDHGDFDHKAEEYVDRGIVVAVNKAFTLLVLMPHGKLTSVPHDECTVLPDDEPPPYVKHVPGCQCVFTCGK
jgi:hypothetical protein